MTLDIKNARDFLQAMDFKSLFNELGWNLPRNVKPLTMVIQNTSYTLRGIAQLAGVTVFEIINPGGAIPDAAMRKAIHKETSTLAHENLLIFLDKDHSQSLWYWVKRCLLYTSPSPRD